MTAIDLSPRSFRHTGTPVRPESRAGVPAGRRAAVAVDRLRARIAGALGLPPVLPGRWYL